MNNRLFGDKDFYRKLFSIALPITAQNLISSSLNMVDTVMIGRLGDTAIASVGLANQYFFLFVLLLFGINSGSSIFIAQFWGKEDKSNIRRMLGLSLIAGTIVALIFTLGGLIIPKTILRIFSEDTEVILQGSSYLRIVCFSYILNTFSFAYGFASRSIGQAKLPMFVSMIALASNTMLNYVLIFGNFGFPEMGVKGAALATLLSRGIEVILLLGIIYKNKGILAGKLYEFLDLTREFIFRVIKTTYPVILNEAIWSLGMTTYSAVYARIGTKAIAAVQISNTIQNIFMVICMGLANACAVMIGNKIGANEEEKGILYAKRFSFLGPLAGVIIGIALFICSPLVLSFFKISDEVYSDARKILIVISLVMAFKVFNAILIVGIFRSGGDTVFSLIMEMGSVWIIGVPLAFIGAFVLKLPIYLVVALVSLEEVVKTVVGIPRLVSKKWIKNVVNDI